MGQCCRSSWRCHRLTNTGRTAGRAPRRACSDSTPSNGPSGTRLRRSGATPWLVATDDENIITRQRRRRRDGVDWCLISGRGVDQRERASSRGCDTTQSWRNVTATLQMCPSVRPRRWSVSTASSNRYSDVISPACPAVPTDRPTDAVSL